MKLELHSRMNDKNAHNVVQCKEISMQMNITTVKTNLPFFDVRYSSSLSCLLDFESGSQHYDKRSMKPTFHLENLKKQVH